MLVRNGQHLREEDAAFRFYRGFLAAFLFISCYFYVISFFLLLFSGFFVYLCTRKPMKLKNYVEITVKVMVAATAP
ncbi:hypothetical protein DW830_07360 [Prevotella sp. AM34-19LB]|jgi:hypothetical protein|nr:hypothetical protein DW830_07360 [Prevotella sp. AM34-19LB]